jgi:hypothetical protein
MQYGVEWLQEDGHKKEKYVFNQPANRGACKEFETYIEYVKEELHRMQVIWECCVIKSWKK